MSFKTPNLAENFGSSPNDDFEEEVSFSVSENQDTSKTPDHSLEAKESEVSQSKEKELSQDEIDAKAAEENPDLESGPEEKSEDPKDEEEDIDEDLAAQEKHFVSSALDYLKEKDKSFEVPDGVTDIDTFTEVVASNAIMKGLEEKGSYYREALKKEVMEEMGVSEEELSMLRGKKYGIDQGRINQMNALSKEMDFPFTLATERENMLLMQTYHSLEGAKPEYAKKMAEIDVAEINKLKDNPSEAQAKIDAVREKIRSHALSEIAKVSKDTSAIEAQIRENSLARMREQERVMNSRMIGGKKRSAEEIMDFKRKLTVADQEIVENGIKKKVTLFYKAFKEMPIQESLDLAYATLYKDEVEEKKEEKKEKAKRRAKGSFLKKKQSKEKIPDFQRIGGREDDDGESITMAVPQINR